MCVENHYAHLGPVATLVLWPGHLPLVVNDEAMGNANGRQTVPGVLAEQLVVVGGGGGGHLGTECVSTANLS